MMQGVIMPTYDYKCTNCGDRFEHFQTMTDAPLTKCTKCNGELKRLIGAGLGPIFKGTGFYQTDYKNNTNSTNSSSTSTTTSTNKTATSTTTEKKSESNTPTTKNPA